MPVSRKTKLLILKDEVLGKKRRNFGEEKTKFRERKSEVSGREDCGKSLFPDTFCFRSCVRSMANSHAPRRKSIVFSPYLEVTLRMVAHRAHVGSRLPDDNVAAVGTLPYGIAVL